MIRAFAAFAIALLSLLPLIWMVATSFKPPLEYVSTSISLLPREPTLAHYRALAEAELWRQGLNSIVVAIGTVALALLTALPAAYGLVRLHLPKRLDLLFLGFVLVIKLAPPIALAIPLYQLLRAIGLIDSLAGLIIVNQIYALPFAIWMLLGFVRDVPVAFEEAAMMDGAGFLRRMRDIVMPLLMPGLIATGVFVAIMSWNEFLFALLFVQTPSNFTLPAYIATLINEDETLWGRLAAIGLLASLPVLASVGLVRKGLLRDIATDQH
jgi:multiple sugar transport system permease protein